MLTHPRVAVLLLGLLPTIAAADEPLPSGPGVAPAIPSLEELTRVQEEDAAARGETSSLGVDVLVLSASRVPFTLQEAPAIMSVITADELSFSGAQTLVDALRTVAELDVTRDGFGFYHVSIRGRRADPEVLVLLDGQRINDFYDGRILYDVPIALVDRIEIIRGPGSAVYGTNAFAGVIAVYSRQSKKNELLVAGATGGGDREQLVPSAFRGAGYLSRRLGSKLELSLAAEGTVGRGAMLQIEDDEMSSGSLACAGSGCPDTAFTNTEQTAGHVTLGLRAPAGLLVKGDTFTALLHGIYQERGPLIGDWAILTPDSSLATRKVLGSLTYDVPLAGDALRATLLTSVDVSAVDRDVQIYPDGYSSTVGDVFPDGLRKRVSFDESLLRDELRLQIRPWKRNTTTLGAELEFASLLDYSIETNYDAVGHHMPEYGLYDAVNKWFPQSGKHRFVLGTYLENVTSLPGDVKLILGGRFDKYSDFGSAVSPRVGVVWRLGPIIAKGFFGRAFRAPTFQELYEPAQFGNFGGYVGNPLLKASTVSTFDGGIFYNQTGKRLSLSLGVTGFRSEIVDSIDRAPLTGMNNLYGNTSDVSTYGGAVEGRLRFRRRHSLFVNASWFKAESDYYFTSPATTQDSDTELTNVPALRANAGLRLGLTSQLSLGGWFSYGGERKNNTRTELEEQYRFHFDPWYTVSAAVEYKNVWQGASLRLLVDNATNAKIADEAFKPSSIPGGVPRDRLRGLLFLDWEI